MMRTLILLVYGVHTKIVNEAGAELPWEGKTYGHWLVRGPSIIASYFKGGGGDPLRCDSAGKGWFPHQRRGHHRRLRFHADHRPQQGRGPVRRRMDQRHRHSGHRHSPSCCSHGRFVGIKRSKWDDRPIEVVKKKPGAEVSRDEQLAFYEGKIANWRLPDDVVFVGTIALDATGKIKK